MELPEGVGDVECDGSMCVGVCEEGKQPIGQMKVKCKESRKKGLFWNKVCRLTKPLKRLNLHDIKQTKSILFLANGGM